MKFSEFITGERAETDDLISFCNRMIRESEECDQFLRDAEQVGDKDLAEFFKEVRAQDRLRLWRAEQLLRQRIS